MKKEEKTALPVLPHWLEYSGETTDWVRRANAPLVAVGAGDLSYESAVGIGETLVEVLNKTTNIQEVYYKKYNPN